MATKSNYLNNAGIWRGVNQWWVGPWFFREFGPKDPKSSLGDETSHLSLIAFSEGETVPFKAPQYPGAAGMGLGELYSVTRNVDCDEVGQFARHAPHFPDGHVVSPFRTRAWSIFSGEEVLALPQVTEEQRAEWRRLHEEDIRREQEYRDQTKIWFEAMGRYVVAFETTCNQLVSVHRAILRHGGVEPNDIEGRLASVRGVFEHLKEIKSGYRKTIKLTTKEQSLANDIFARVEKCLKARNKVIHSTWLPGGINPAYRSTFHLAQGSQGERLFDASTLDWHRERCVDAVVLLGDLINRFEHPRPFDAFMELKSDGTLERRLDYTFTRGKIVPELYAPAVSDEPTQRFDVFAGQTAVGEGLAVRLYSMRDFEDLLFRYVERFSTTPCTPDPLPAFGVQALSSTFLAPVDWLLGQIERRKWAD